MNKKSLLSIGIVVGIVVVVSVMFFFVNKGQIILLTGEPSQVNWAQKGELLTMGEGEQGGIDTNPLRTIDTGVRTRSPLTYDQALALYKNNTIQFNDSCQIVNKDRSYHLTNEVMIDNRGAKPKAILIGSKRIVLGPYDFGFLILEEKGDAIPVSCEHQNNVGTLSVQ